MIKSETIYINVFTFTSIRHEEPGIPPSLVVSWYNDPTDHCDIGHDVSEAIDPEEVLELFEFLKKHMEGTDRAIAGRQ